jgi:spermidine synthase
MTPSAFSHMPAAVALGMMCQIGQILFLRELLMVFHGSELSIGIILAAWLAWVGAGSRLGAVCVERSARPRVLLAYAGVATLVLLPATVLLIRGLRGFFQVLPGAHLSLADMLVACFLVMPPCACCWARSS